MYDAVGKGAVGKIPDVQDIFHMNASRDGLGDLLTVLFQHCGDAASDIAKSEYCCLYHKNLLHTQSAVITFAVCFPDGRMYSTVGQERFKYSRYPKKRNPQTPFARKEIKKRKY